MFPFLKPVVLRRDLKQHLLLAGGFIVFVTAELNGNGNSLVVIQISFSISVDVIIGTLGMRQLSDWTNCRHVNLLDKDFFS